MNDPTSTSGSGRCSAYFDAIREAEDDVTDALGHIRAEEDAGRITTVEAATERVGLLGAAPRAVPPATRRAPRGIMTGRHGRRRDPGRVIIAPAENEQRARDLAMAY